MKSDDTVGRVKTYEAIVKGQNIPAPGVPESFKVLVKELQSLCLDIRVLDADKNIIEIPELDPEDSAPNDPPYAREEIDEPGEVVDDTAEAGSEPGEDGEITDDSDDSAFGMGEFSAEDFSLGDDDMDLGFSMDDDTL